MRVTSLTYTKVHTHAHTWSSPCNIPVVFQHLITHSVHLQDLIRVIQGDCPLHGKSTVHQKEEDQPCYKQTTIPAVSKREANGIVDFTTRHAAGMHLMLLGTNRGLLDVYSVFLQNSSHYSINATQSISSTASLTCKHKLLLAMGLEWPWCTCDYTIQSTTNNT